MKFVVTLIYCFKKRNIISTTLSQQILNDGLLLAITGVQKSNLSGGFKLELLRDATSTTFLQYFYNKSWVVSYYWFKFEFSIEITFLTQQ